jgi:hypothetical protein
MMKSWSPQINPAFRIRHSKKIGAAVLVSLALCFTLIWTGIFAPDSIAQNHTPAPHGNLKTACKNCHNSTGYKPIRTFPDFDHNRTGFSLGGMHKGLDCRQCHVKLVFSNIATECAGCHADIHRRQMGSDCKQCHSVRGWREVVRPIDGHANRFPLLGSHRVLECQDCHKSAAVGLYRGLNTDCAFCHIEDYNSAQSVDHKALGYSTKCETCHSMDGWAQNFDHAQLTGFPLSGAHSALDCFQCHPGGNFSGAVADCSSCHLLQYNSATNPNHITAGFPQDCAVCHGTSAWVPAQYNHGATSFPLTGAHAPLTCSACHSNGQYGTLPTACVSCHLTQYNQAANPNHVTAAFPQDCSICHSTSAWIPSTFSHSSTRFPLTGAHTSVPCANCHIGGVYAGTPRDCYSCHSGEYASVTDPNHVAAGFPRDCSQCHTTSGWSGAQFAHTQFPIYSGTHAGRWTTCGTCHTNSTNYSVFTCFNCHEHDKTITDSRHSGISNYVYNSANCYSCHPNGRAD